MRYSPLAAAAVLLAPTHLRMLASSGNEEFAALTVKQLKERLRSLGLPVSGLKAELISRLAAGAAVGDDVNSPQSLSPPAFPPPPPQPPLS